MQQWWLAICTVIWLCNAALATCELQCARCIMHYCTAAIVLCSLYCTNYVIYISALNWWFAICAVQVTCQCTALQHWWLISIVQDISKAVQCSTSHLQIVVCQLCYVVQQCTSGEFQFALCKLLRVGTALDNRRNSICTLPGILRNSAVQQQWIVIRRVEILLYVIAVQLWWLAICTVQLHYWVFW